MESSQFENIKCTPAFEGPPNGAPVRLARQTPMVAAGGAAAPSPQDHRHRPPALQLSDCHAPRALSVASPTFVRVAEDQSSPQAGARLRHPSSPPAAARLRPQTPLRAIKLAAMPAPRSPVTRSFYQTNGSPSHSPAARRTIGSPANAPAVCRRIPRHPSRGASPVPSPTGSLQLVPAAAAPDETPSPCHTQHSTPKPKSDAGVEPLRHEKISAVRRSPSPAITEEHRRLGSINDSNTTAPPSPSATVYFGTPCFRSRDVRCDDLQLRLGLHRKGTDSQKTISMSDLHAEPPAKPGAGSSGSQASPDTAAGVSRSYSECTDKTTAGVDMNK